MVDPVTHENSAVRIYRIFERMVAQPDGIPIATALSNAIELSSKTTACEQAQSLYRAIALLFEELNCLREALKQKHSERAYQHVDTAFERFVPQMLASQWMQSKPVFQQSLPVLFIFGESLVNEGFISADDLKQVKTSLEKFRDEVEIAEWPEDLKRYVAQQVGTMIRAISDYPISGVKAFKAGIKDIYFDQAENSEIIEEHANTEPMIRLTKFFATMWQWSKYPLEAGKLLSAGDTIYTHGAKVLHAAGHLSQQAAEMIHNFSK